MADEVDRVEAGGHEAELRAIIDEVEAAREFELRGAKGRGPRSAIIGEIKAEVLRRFAERHPDVRARFLSGPYQDEDAPKGPEGRVR
jgi:hypothetical protein